MDVKLRPAAEQDLVNETRHYALVGGRALGEKLFDAALGALKPLERMPKIGSPRLGRQCEIPGLRSWRVKGFPLQWLYVVQEDHVDVIRLLGDRQDIAAILSDVE